MIIRSMVENDWQEMLSVYNRCLLHDQIDEKFFIQHFLLNPNFSPENVIIMEENGAITGWTYAMIVTKNLDSWSRMAENMRNVGHIMVPAAADLDSAVKLIAAAEKNLAERSCSRIRCGLPGYTLFPNGVDKSLYPFLHEAFERLDFYTTGCSHSMQRSLENYSMPLEYQQKIDALARDENIVVKVADVQDILPLRRFFEKSATGWMHLISRKWAEDKLNEMVIVRQGDEIIGCCQYNYFGMVDRVGPFRVADHMNGRGIGTVMIAKLFEVMTQNNIKHAWFASCVKDLIHFYQKNGLQVFRQKSIFYKDL